MYNIKVIRILLMYYMNILFKIILSMLIYPGILKIPSGSCDSCSGLYSSSEESSGNSSSINACTSDEVFFTGVIGHGILTWAAASSLY